MTQSSSPVNFPNVASGATWVDLDDHACVVVSGNLVCSGFNANGTLTEGETFVQTALATPIFVGSAAKLTVTGPSTVAPGACSTAFTVRLRDSSDNLVTSVGARTVNLGSASMGSFYATAGCGGGTVTSVTMGAGTDTATFYYSNASAMDIGINVSTTGIARTGIKLTVQ
jgi:hypothetical protein